MKKKNSQLLPVIHWEVSAIGVTAASVWSKLLPQLLTARFRLIGRESIRHWIDHRAGSSSSSNSCKMSIQNFFFAKWRRFVWANQTARVFEKGTFFLPKDSFTMPITYISGYFQEALLMAIMTDGMAEQPQILMISIKQDSFLVLNANQKGKPRLHFQSTSYSRLFHIKQNIVMSAYLCCIPRRSDRPQTSWAHAPGSTLCSSSCRCWSGRCGCGRRGRSAWMTGLGSTSGSSRSRSRNRRLPHGDIWMKKYCIIKRAQTFLF